MKKICCFIMTASLLFSADQESLPHINALKLDEEQSKKAEEANNWLRTQLKEIEKLQPGHTRADLLKLFQPEGGLSSPSKGRFIYLYCSDIKIDVEFEPVGKRDTLTDGWNQDDIIKTISKPYLDSITIID